MTKDQRQRLAALPAFLQPRLRLFLSVDLVGSTASKQRLHFPLGEPKGLWPDTGMVPPWLSPIANFFGSFREEFVREWRLFKQLVAPSLNIEVSVDPLFWKANGDELIFVKELYDRKEVIGCVNAWLKALKALRAQLIVSGLDIKATAWIAGFPITNSEFVFQLNPASAMEFEDEPRLYQFGLLERWHENPSLRHDLMMDFIGPSMDTGFRLATLSSPREFVVSVDVAYFLATSHLPPKSEIEMPSIFFNGTSVLKGVLGGKPYPVFWIDTKKGDDIAVSEDRLRSFSASDLEDIKRFCLAFYDDNCQLMFIPFVHREDPSQYGEIPPNYVEALEHLHGKWEREKARYKGEGEIGSEQAGPRSTLTASESDSIERKIAALLAERESKR